MKELGQQSINPDSIITKVMEQRRPSLSGLPRKHMVSVGHTAEGGQYILLGSARQVALFVEVDEGIRTTTVHDILRLHYDHLPENQLKAGGVKEIEITHLRKNIEDGSVLTEGVFAIVSRPGSPSIIEPNVKGVWAPVEQGLGKDWKLV